jgi:hypothetical protein
MWETVAGLVVEADPQIMPMPEGVEFVGNWESETEAVERVGVELN